MPARTYIEETGYRAMPFAASLRAFTKQRAGLLNLLQPLPPEAWERTAKFPGKSLRADVLSSAYRLARHERGHLKQVASIARAVSRQR